MKAFLLALEIEPVEAGGIYDSLPLHCTLVHWFWVGDETDLLSRIAEETSQFGKVRLQVESEKEFTGMTKNGPIPVRVNTVAKTSDIDTLHERITRILESMGVRYSAPQYIHSGYVPHVTHQKGSRLNENDSITATILYLVEASAPEYGNERKVIQRFSLVGPRK